MPEDALTNKQISPAPHYNWPAARADAPDVSIVAPMFNEVGGAAELAKEIAGALSDFDFEIIIVDDGSTDGTVDALLALDMPQLRVLCHGRNAGQSRALRTGVLAARSAVIATLDGDGQNNPADIPMLLEALRDGGPAVTMVAGERQKRQDTAAKKWASGLANGLRKRVLKDGANDTGCGLKVFYREAFLRLPYFDHIHRYLPALMRREGFEIAFRPVSHRSREHGTSKYTNLGRLAVAIRDLSGVIWLLARARQPVEIIERSPQK